MITVAKYGLKIYDMMLDVVPPDAVFVGRPMSYVNPYSHVKGASLHLTKSAKESVAKYREYVGRALGVGKEARRHLKGKNLSCNCGESVYCHATVVMELANEPAPPQNPMLAPDQEKSSWKKEATIIPEVRPVVRAPVPKIVAVKEKKVKYVPTFKEF